MGGLGDGEYGFPGNGGLVITSSRRCLVPYLTLLSVGGRFGKVTFWASSLSGLIAALGWYVAGYAPTSTGILHTSAPRIMGAIHPFFVAIPASFTVMVLSAAVSTILEPRAPAVAPEE